MKMPIIKLIILEIREIKDMKGGIISIQAITKKNRIPVELGSQGVEPNIDNRYK